MAKCFADYKVEHDLNGQNAVVDNLCMLIISSANIVMIASLECHV